MLCFAMLFHVMRGRRIALPPQLRRTMRSCPMSWVATYHVLFRIFGWMSNLLRILTIALKFKTIVK